MSPRRAVPIAVAVGVLAGTLAGCRADEPAVAGTPVPSTLAEVAADAVEVPRASFCDLVPEAAVRAALGGAAADTEMWGNGEAGPDDVAGGEPLHEFGCSWTYAATTARAWVFAPPVARRDARALAREEAGPKCRAIRRVRFGRPGSSQSCVLNRDAWLIRHAGLFGDAWVACTLQAPREGRRAAVVARADAWCAAVVSALDRGREAS